MKPGTKAHDHRTTTGHTVRLDETYDAYYCMACNVWLEERCEDPECSFCTARPAKPGDHVVP